MEPLSTEMPCWCVEGWELGKSQGKSQDSTHVPMKDPQTWVLEPKLEELPPQRLEFNKPMCRSQEFGRAPGTIQQECSETEVKPRGHSPLVAKGISFLCSGSVPSSLRTTPHSVLVLTTPCCNSILYSIDFPISSAWVWALWASSSCLFYLQLYTKCLPTGGLQNDFEMSKAEIEWGYQEVQEKAYSQSNPSGEVSPFSRCPLKVQHSAEALPSFLKVGKWCVWFRPFE